MKNPNFDKLLENTLSIIKNTEFSSIVIQASQILRDVEQRDITTWKGWYPWSLLLLIKWAFKYGSRNRVDKAADLNLLEILVKNIFELESFVEPIFLDNQKDPARFLKFFRTLAYRQFWTHKGFGSWNIARQIALFGELNDSHVFQKRFREKYGLSFLEHLELSSLLLAWLIKFPNRVTFKSEQVFGSFQYSEYIVNQYLDSISLSPDEVQNYLSSRSGGIESPFLQFTEKSPLINYPLVKIQDSFFVYSQRVFEEMVNTFFHRIIKGLDSGNLSDHFGEIFENYITESLNALEITYLNEKRLKEDFPDSKIVDFLVPFKEFTLLIEAKAVEIRESVSVYPNSKQLTNELEDNVTKGIVQAFSIAENLTKHNLYSLKSQKYYLMLVTYQDCYLGPGEEIWEEVLKNPVLNELEIAEISPSLIPPGRIIILSLHEFDLMLSIVYEEWASLSQIITNFEKINSDVNTRMFKFDQHLDQYYKDKSRLPYLDKRFEKITNSVIRKSK